MRVLISADMEGATGVTWPADVEPGTEQWQRCRRMFTSDVNAAVAGFFDAGAGEVLVNEAHATMRNLLLEELDPRALMLTGRHKELSMVEGIQDPAVGAVAFIGYHAAAGAEGVLAHTYLPNSVTRVRVNGEPGSEGRLNSLVAAEYGVPVVLVTGDDRTCDDAVSYAPHALTVAVKECVSRYAAICHPPERTAAAIRAAAAKAGTLAGQRSPTPVGRAGGEDDAGPGGGDVVLSGGDPGADGGDVAPGGDDAEPHGYTVEIEVDSAQLAQAAAIVPTVRRTADRAVTYHSRTAWDMIRCFKTVTTMIDAAVEDTYG